MDQPNPIGERLARIEAIMERVENAVLSLDFVPRPEIEASHKRMNARIDKLEQQRDAMFRWIVGSWLTVLGTAALAAWNKLFP